MIAIADLSQRTDDFEETLRCRFSRTKFEVVSYRDISECPSPTCHVVTGFWIRCRGGCAASSSAVCGSDRSLAQRALRTGKAIYIASYLARLSKRRCETLSTNVSAGMPSARMTSWFSVSMCRTGAQAKIKTGKAGLPLTGP